MNFIYLSPHFPPNYKQFCINLHYLGVNVLGLADEPYELLDPELQSVLTEYYRVMDMHNYDELLRAMGYFTHKYGKLDRVESHNEYWLETEARLRTDFNIHGLKNDDILHVKKKSLMKHVFNRAGVKVARGQVVQSFRDAKKLIAKTGYPVVAKPDIGVGAAITYTIHNDAQLKDFFATKPDLDYIVEEYVSGIIQTFDGLVDRDGNLVFYTSHQYSQGIMEIVNQDELVYYYSLRDIPSDLEDAGRRVLKAYDVRERFFHFEFFRTPQNEIVALEVNMRPPGGFTTDMFNYANDIDIYHEWAHVVVFNKFTAEYSRKYHSCYVSRKFNRQYVHSHQEILDAFGECCITHHDAISGVFSAALGDYGYLIRSPNLDEIFAMAAYIQELA